MLKTMRRAFPQTMPVMAGYLFLGIAFGAAMQSRGLPAWQSLLLSTAVYGGSLQFALVDSLCAAFAPLTVALLSALIHAVISAALEIRSPQPFVSPGCLSICV